MNPRPILFILFLLLLLAPLPAAGDSLPSWKDGPVKTAILEWITDVTDPAGEDFIPLPERIAVFDNDGTSTCERPENLARKFRTDLVRGMAERGEVDGESMPLKAWIAGDRDSLRAYGYKKAYLDLNAAFAGMDVAAYADSVEAWVALNRHPRFDQPYQDLYYRPMQELHDLLVENGFQVWIVTGSPQSVIRVISDRAMGIPPERVIGTTTAVAYEVSDEGTGRVVRSAGEAANTYEAKPGNILTRIGRRPVFAAGNSNNDEPMSRYAMTGSRRGFVLWIHHDDPDREYEYDNSTDRIGGLVAERDDAHEVSMKNDWVRVFGFEED